MTNEIKKLVGAKKIIDYSTICYKYILILNYYIQKELNLNELEKIVEEFKKIHNIFYPEYESENIEIDLLTNMDELILSSVEMIDKLNIKIDDLRKLELITEINENIKRHYYVKTRKIKIIN